MKTRNLILIAALAAGAAAALVASAEGDYSEIDIAELQAQAKEYRHRSDVLRKMIGLRERKIGAVQQQADALMRQAQADAAARQAAAAQAQSDAAGNAQVIGFLGSFIPGGNSLGGDMLKSGLNGMAQGAVNQANANARLAGAQGAAMVGGAKSDADSLMSQAEQFQGEKKKLVYKARQYEQLADSKDLLAAGEVLRLRAQESVKTVDGVDREIESARAFVQGVSVW